MKCRSQSGPQHIPIGSDRSAVPFNAILFGRIERATRSIVVVVEIRLALHGLWLLYVFVHPVEDDIHHLEI